MSRFLARSTHASLSSSFFTLEAEPSDTINDVKLMLQDKGFPSDGQYSFFCKGRNVVDGHATLSDCNVGDKSTVYLITRRRFAESRMMIFVETLAGKTIMLFVERGHTVD